MISHDFDDQNQSGREPMNEHATLPSVMGTSDESMNFGAGESTSLAKRHGVGLLLLAGVVVVAIIGLYSMRTLTKASAATDTPSEIEKSIESFLNMLSDGSVEDRLPDMPSKENESVLHVLNESYTERQVPLDGVQRNPFIIEGAAKPDEPVVKDTPKVDPIIEQRRVRTAQIDKAAARLRLRSVMLGDNPLANINNKIVRIGETLHMDQEDVTFRVTWIDADSAGLVAEDPELELSIGVTVKIRRD